MSRALFQPTPGHAPESVREGAPDTPADNGSLKFSRSFAGAVRRLLAGRYIIGDALEWRGPGLLLGATEAFSAAPVTILIVDPARWESEAAFDAAAHAARRLATCRDAALILPQRVLTDFESRCLVLILEPVEGALLETSGRAFDVAQAREVGVTLVRAAQSLREIDERPIQPGELWIEPAGGLRVLRIPGPGAPDEMHTCATARLMLGLMPPSVASTEARLLRELRAREIATKDDAAGLDALEALLTRPRARARWLPWLAGAAALAWLCTSLTWVGSGDTAIVTGAWGGERTLDPGLHLKWPAPFEMARTVAPAPPPTSDESSPAPIELITEPLPVEPAPVEEESTPEPPTPEPAQAPVEQDAPAEAEPQPYPTEALGVYLARAGARQTRAAIEQIASLRERLARQRADALRANNSAEAEALASALRIVHARGATEAWNDDTRLRLSEAEDELARGDTAAAMQALERLLAETLRLREALEPIEDAARAATRAGAAREQWNQIPLAARTAHEDSARTTIARIEDAQHALETNADLPASIAELNEATEALEVLALAALSSAAATEQARAQALLDQWDANWSGPAGASFTPPQPVATAREHLSRGRAQLQQQHPRQAIDSFQTAAQLLEEQLAWLQRERTDAVTPDETGRTALHRAAAAGDADAVRYALALGAPLQTKDKTGATPFALAVTAGQVPAARVLLQHGADVNQRAPSGRPLIFETAAHPDAFLLLLESGARANWTVRSGTPLHQVAWARSRHGVGDADQIRMATALLDRGVDPAATDASGETALQIAERTRAAALADFLRKKALFGREWNRNTEP